MPERISGYPFPSLSLELAFLSSCAVRSLLKASFTDEDKRVFGKGADFFCSTLKGMEAVETLRVTPTSVEDTKKYLWGLKILSTLELGKGAKSREEIGTIFTGFKNTLEALEHSVPNETTEVTKQQVQEVTTFFARMGELAKEPKLEPIDSRKTYITRGVKIMSGVENGSSSGGPLNQEEWRRIMDELGQFRTI